MGMYHELFCVHAVEGYFAAPAIETRVATWLRRHVARECPQEDCASAEISLARPSCMCCTVWSHLPRLSATSAGFKQSGTEQHLAKSCQTCRRLAGESVRVRECGSVKVRVCVWSVCRWRPDNRRVFRWWRNALGQEHVDTYFGDGRGGARRPSVGLRGADILQLCASFRPQAQNECVLFAGVALERACPCKCLPRAALTP